MKAKNLIFCKGNSNQIWTKPQYHGNELIVKMISVDRSTNHANVILNSERFQKLFLHNRHDYIIDSDTVCDKITNLISNYMLLLF